MAGCAKHILFDSSCAPCQEDRAYRASQREAEDAHRRRLDDLRSGRVTEARPAPVDTSTQRCSRHFLFDDDCAECRHARRSRSASTARADRHRREEALARELAGPSSGGSGNLTFLAQLVVRYLPWVAAAVCAWIVIAGVLANIEFLAPLTFLVSAAALLVRSSLTKSRSLRLDRPTRVDRVISWTVAVSAGLTLGLAVELVVAGSVGLLVAAALAVTLRVLLGPRLFARPDDSA